MSIIFIEGFDTYDDITGTIGGMFSRWSCSFSPQLSLVAAEGSDSGQQLNLHAGGGEEPVTCPIGSNVVQGTLGVQYHHPSGGFAGFDVNIFSLRDGGSRQLTFAVTSTGAIKAFSGNGASLLGTTAAGVIVSNTVQCLEFGFKIHDSTGTIDIWVAGVNVLHLTGLDTHVTTNAYVDTIEINEGYVDAKYDHIYMSDVVATILDPGVTTGDFFKVGAFSPSADKSNTGYAPDSGVTLYDRIDTLLGNPADTEYIQGDNANDEFLVEFANIGVTGKLIQAVSLIGIAKKDATDSRSIKLQQEQGGTKVLGTAQSLTNGTYTVKRQIFNTDGVAAAWTEAKFNSATFGSKSV